MALGHVVFARWPAILYPALSSRCSASIHRSQPAGLNPQTLTNTSVATACTQHPPECLHNRIHAPSERQCIWCVCGLRPAEQQTCASLILIMRSTRRLGSACELPASPRNIHFINTLLKFLNTPVLVSSLRHSAPQQHYRAVTSGTCLGQTNKFMTPYHVQCILHTNKPTTSAPPCTSPTGLRSSTICSAAPAIKRSGTGRALQPAARFLLQ